MNNADSFAIAFDEIWKTDIANLKEEELNKEEKINLALSKIKDHPFLINNPSTAEQVAKFRVSLLQLN